MARTISRVAALLWNDESDTHDLRPGGDDPRATASAVEYDKYRGGPRFPPYADPLDALRCDTDRHQWRLQRTYPHANFAR